jgi:cell division protein FtsI (penicillin-binding protein 3)
MTLFKRVIHDHHSYASLSMADVLAKSSNIGAINIGLRVGEQNLFDYVKRFGFGKSTGIPLPGESAGRVRPLKKWIASSIGSVAMGHELSSTTLQLAQACSVIANGGLLVKPRLTLKRQRPGSVPDAVEPATQPVRVIQPQTAITMRQMMEGVVLHGTGKKAKLDGYTSGGKTGTAQIYDFKARAYTHKYNSSFMGFAPLNNPALVVVVTLNGTAAMGAEASAPVFREVASFALRILDVPKDLPETGETPSDDKTSENDLAIADLSNPLDDDNPEMATQVGLVAANNNGGAPLPEEIPPAAMAMMQPAADAPKVPNYRGKTLREVLEDSSSSGIPVDYVGRGIARNQTPLPGVPLRHGERVRVEFTR